jgi:hypothetical protein
MKPIHRLPGLLSNEHGALCEARAKAILLERFWVLERSVDVHGADLLVQRRNLFERKAQILGRIQAKFVQDGRTRIRIRHRDLLDQYGAAQDYFLLIFTGFGTEARTFLISAQEIVNNFRCVAASDRKFYQIAAKEILESNRFEIIDQGKALDRVEDALKRADFQDFIRNRRFVLKSHFLETEIDPAHIDEDYEIPLHSWNGNLREDFFRTKKQLQSAILDMTEAIEHLRNFVEHTDPVEAWSQIEQFMAWHGRDGSLSLSWDLFEQEFIEEAIRHRRKLDKLRELNVEEAYLGPPERIQELVIMSLTPYLPLTTSQSYVVTIGFDRPTFAVESFAAELQLSVEKITWRAKIETIGEHSVRITYPIDLFHTFEIEQLTCSDSKGKEQILRSKAWVLSRDFMDWIDETILRLYEPPVWNGSDRPA